jgi:hypothetical protein
MSNFEDKLRLSQLSRCQPTVPVTEARIIACANGTRKIKIVRHGYSVFSDVRGKKDGVDIEREVGGLDRRRGFRALAWCL